MKFYDVRLMPDEEIKYSKEKEYSDFTTFLQSVINFKDNRNTIKEKTLFFNITNNKIECYNKDYLEEIYNNLHIFFKNSDKEKYTVMSLKINFEIVVKVEEEIHYIFKEKMKISSKNMLTYYSYLIKKAIQLFKKDSPSIFECYILYFEHESNPVLQRIFLKSEEKNNNS